MKTKQLLCLTVFILLVTGWRAPIRAQEIPINYNQNPNIEHEFSTLFWSGWDDTYFGIYSHPGDYKTDEYAHSGTHSLEIWVQPGGAYGTWVWVSYPVRGHEQKKMKASFWYRGYLDSYFNFIYRDVGMTFEDLHPDLAEYVGADTAYYIEEGQNALKFDFLRDQNYVDDWTYFEFVWDFPGTIKGLLNTAMWYANRDSAYVDDIYYGEWYDGQYSGEEPIGFIGGDFEKNDLDKVWLLNVAAVDNYFGTSDFLSLTENHSDAGFQSMRLTDYWEIYPDTNDVVAPYDSIDQVTTFMDKNVTYYLPALGQEGKDMTLRFWYKGNDATLDVEFYDDYGITTSEFPLPAGAMLYADSANPVYTYDTVQHVADDTAAVEDLGAYTSYLELLIDTANYQPETVLAEQDFDDPADQALPGEWAWIWSGSNFYGYNDWGAATVADDPFSVPEALWIPGDPGWTGAEGYVSGIVDGTKYMWEFMYKGQVQFDLHLGSDLKYDLANDPDGLVPVGATVMDKEKDGKVVYPNAMIHWELDSKHWTQFRFEYEQGTWLADSSATSPATVTCGFVGAYDWAANGWVDDFLVAIATDAVPDIIDTNYVVVRPDFDTTYTYPIASTTYNPVGARWDLPAATEWTKWQLNWTNPSTDIGGTLTMILDNDTVASPQWITQDNKTLDDDHAGWTFFDDFVYGISTGIYNKSVMQNNLHIYPNPTIDVLYLSIEDQLQRIDVYNSVGQLVKSINNPDRKFNVSDLPSGIYMLNVTDQRGNLYQSKFIKK